MSPVVYGLLGGWTFLPGVLLLLATVGLFACTNNGRLRLLGSVAAMVAAAAVYLASPGVPFAVIVAFWCVWVVWYTLEQTPQRWVRRTRIVSRVTLIVIATVTAAFELPWWRMPRLAGGTYDAILVVGDSLSAGLSPGDEIWPWQIARALNVEVNNAAFPGATVDGAIDRQLPVVAHHAGVVIVEIGGNDLISEKPAEQFHRELDELLGALKQPDRVIVMFELPVPPWQAAYLRSQRTLARKHGVQLIPRRAFVDVLHAPDATTDGFHLTNQGHTRMAELVASVVRPVLVK